MHKLLFVYNADSGLLNTMKDWAHKLASPSTYSCRLCALTYDNLGMRRPWRDFIRELGVEVDFLHRDELEQRHAIKNAPLPAAFLQRNGQMSVWITSNEMNACDSVEALQALVSRKIAREKG